MTDLTLRAETYRQTTDAYRATAIVGEAGLTHQFSDTVKGSVAVSVERSHVVDAMMTAEDHLLTSLTSSVDWDTRDSRFDPTKGLHALLTSSASYDFLQKNAFATVRGDLSVYRALDRSARFVLAGRVSVATLFAGDILDVPADRRLYAGGAGSVRGYAYRNIAPRDMSDNLIGGKSLFEVSGEVRYRVNDQLGLVGFIDAGNAYASAFPKFTKLKFGVGAGVRYLTPVGPLRFDAAIPLQRGPGDPKFAVYVGLGQAF